MKSRSTFVLKLPHFFTLLYGEGKSAAFSKLTYIWNLCLIFRTFSVPYSEKANLKNYLDRRDITMVAYSPLGSPNRPWGKPTDPKLVNDKNLARIGAKYGGKSAAQVALRYLVSNKDINDNIFYRNSKIFLYFSVSERNSNCTKFSKVDKDWRKFQYQWFSFEERRHVFHT